MITTRNEFETVPAYEHLSGSSFGTWSDRETTITLINILDTVQSHIDTKPLYKELAELSDDDDSGAMFDLQNDVMDHLNYYMPMPEFCSVVLDDNEFTVIPSIELADEDCKNFADYQDTYQGDFILVTNDHGNVTCQQWDYNKLEYTTIWDMV